MSLRPAISAWPRADEPERAQVETNAPDGGAHEADAALGVIDVHGSRGASRFQGVMRGSKDSALAFGARTLLNSRLSAIGKITDLTVDTADRRARLRMALRGERGVIDLADLRYDIHRADGSDWLTLVDAVTSREWRILGLPSVSVVVGRATDVF